MKELTERDFQLRMRQIRDARLIFGHMTDYNISVAYAIYREMFDEKDLPEYVTYKRGGAPKHVLLRKYSRPQCPKCGKPLHLRHICKPQGKENLFGYRSCWECMAEDCYYEDFSTRDVRWQVKQLKLKGES